jgi:3-methyladenine DNA glycosylase Mpg
MRLDGKGIFILDDGFVIDESYVLSSTRIGIRVGTESEWRYFLRGNEFVSRRQPRK